MWQVWLVGLGTVSALMVVTWVISAVRRDASIVDRVWSVGFIVAAWTYAIAADAWTPRTWLALALVTIWGARLAIYITVRNWGEGEDKRYQRMRERRPQSFTARSLVTIFLLQGLLAWLVSLPLLGATAIDVPVELIWLDYLAIVVWMVGFVFEAGGDWQLSRFLADPANRGKVMDRGLWRYTRHPNYFGDTTVWWAYLLLALSTGAWWGAVGTILMTAILLTTGVGLTDKNMTKGGSKREGFDEYVARTNTFFPGPPKPRDQARA